MDGYNEKSFPDLSQLVMEKLQECHREKIRMKEIEAHSGVSRSTIWRLTTGKHQTNLRAMHSIWDSCEQLLRLRMSQKDAERESIAKKLGLKL